MPSRAGADALGSFSYYEHVYLPESVKDLVWEHGGERYRSQMVIRTNGKRKTEAFLHQRSAGGWQPVRLADGTVSDGKLETYVRCVEGILGSAETFFTSVFCAQGKRQLTAWAQAAQAHVPPLLGCLEALQCATPEEIATRILEGIEEEGAFDPGASPPPPVGPDSAAADPGEGSGCFQRTCSDGACVDTEPADMTN